MATSNLAPAPPIIAIKLTAPWERAYAGEWLPMVIEMQRPADSADTLFFESMKCEDPNVQIDTDLVQSRLELRPAEAYRCTVPIRAAHPCQVSLGTFVFAFSKVDPETGRPQVLKFKSAARTMTVKPALNREIETIVKPICRYEEGVKVAVTFTHRGNTPFQDWSLSLGPIAEIKAGKPVIQKALFVPGERESIELVINSDKLDVIHSATINGHRGEFREQFAVSSPPIPEGKRFRFLEPTRLAQDSIRIFRLVGDDRMFAEKRQEAFVLSGGERYLVEIEPRSAGVREVKLNGLGHQVQVLKTEPKGGVWTFTIDVAALNVFRAAERLYYEVTAESGKFAGEIPVCLISHWTRHARLAATAGAALSLQGLIGLGKWIGSSEHSVLEAISEFSLSEHLSLIGMTLSTPFLWAGVKVVDWLQYRLLR